MDEYFMSLALQEARGAALLGEVPVGAILVQEGKVIATGKNLREQDKTALAHAELLAIAAGCKALGSWRLEDCTLYVTLEPCPMCTGAIINARIPRVVFGAPDPKAGCMGSVCDLPAMAFNHCPEVIKGVLQEECATVLKEFFEGLRERNRLRKQVEELPTQAGAQSKELEPFLDGEKRLKQFPAKRRGKLLALFYLAGKFDPHVQYTEWEVNRLLGQWHTFGDPATLRRELFNHHFIARQPNGSRYWLEPVPPTMESLEKKYG